MYWDIIKSTISQELKQNTPGRSSTTKSITLKSAHENRKEASGEEHPKKTDFASGTAERVG